MGCKSTFQMCNDPKCCASENDACYQRVGHSFHLCRPLEQDGSCRDSPAWRCPRDVDYADNVDSSDAAAGNQLAVAGSDSAFTLVRLQRKVFRNPIVLALGATAGMILLLLLLLIVWRKVSLRRHALRHGTSPKTKHTRIRGREDDIVPAQAEEDDDDDQNEDEDEILGDEEAAESKRHSVRRNARKSSDILAAVGHEESPDLLEAVPEQGGGGVEQNVKELETEEELLKRVHALLSDAKPEPVGGQFD